MNGQCFILTGGPFDNCKNCAPAPAAGDLVIACDAGYLTAQKFGLTPDLIVGDFDSYQGEIPRNIRTLKTPVRKDDTDTMTGLRIGLERGYSDFTLIGAFGARLDHTLANLQALCWLCEQGVHGKILSDENHAWAIKDGTLTLPRMAGWHLSVFAACGECTGVTLRGVAYPLTEYTMTPAFPLGVSNEFAADHAVITVAHGTLFIIASREIKEDSL